MGRGEQLKRALPVNLFLAARYRRDVTFNVALRQAKAGRGLEEHEELKQRLLFSEYWIITGFLVVAETFDLPWWNSSVAKNTAHSLGATVSADRARLAEEQGRLNVLWNLDCDNVVTSRWLAEMPEKVRKDVEWTGCGAWRWGGEDLG